MSFVPRWSALVPIACLAALSLALILASCGEPGDTAVDERSVPPTPSEATSESASVSPSGVTGDDGPYALVAENIAFSPTDLAFERGTDVTIRFENRDVVQHGFSVFPEGSEDEESAVFLGTPIEQGSTRYGFPAPEAGTYVFVCPVHPEDMVGTITVG